jgi:prepilin-type N-terminal cleavage/methylation domain-containing protein
MKKVKYIQSGYTLIELIVVIALVMILGRIAFASYSSYMSDTRNTKRTVDLNRLQSVIETREIGSDLSIISFVDDSTPVNVITGAVNEVS